MATGQAVEEFSKDEKGSISVLIIGLGIIALTLSIGILDFSDAFLAKRELLQISEEATQRAAHEISLSDYYRGNFESQSTMQIPLDCNASLQTIAELISNSRLRGNQILVQETSCDGNSVGVTLKSSIRPIVKFTLLNSLFGGTLEITAKSTAASILPSP